MNSQTTFKTIREFLYQEKKEFVIPNYQRGYKWAVKYDNKESAVEKLMIDLKKAYKNQDYFLQGVTVSESNDNKIILIDGQQRTTTLYLLLRCLDTTNIKDINLVYDIREQSKEFIHSLKDKNFDYVNFNKDEEPQDIYYFKEAIRQIDLKLKEIDDKLEFYNFLLNNVKILYINIDIDKATKTFTMMNGSKATMLQEELVKAEMLRRVSLPDIIEKKVSSSVDDNLNDLKEIISKDWETNALRSRYAREWDKWLYWWNRKDVKEYFGIEKPMGYLLDMYFGEKNKRNESFNFENFKAELFEIGITVKQKTKKVFKELRDLQKSFEDIFNIPKSYNYLKLSLLCSNEIKDKLEIIEYFKEKKSEIKLLEDYAKWRLVGATHRQITKENELRNDENSKEEKAENALKQLSQSLLYQNENAKDLALKQLLRLNVEEDNKLFNGKGRKFDFSIFGNKSLEHIHPKSKVYHQEKYEKNGIVILVYKDGNGEDLGENEPIGNNWLNRDDLGFNLSEHSIGNLLLLDKNENSKFNNRSFSDKKIIYFNINETFRSRNLLHTISVFANSNWTKDEIIKNQEQFIKRFKTDYKINDNNISI